MASRKKILIITSVLITVIAASLLAWLLRVKSPETEHISGKCSDYYTGLYESIGPGNIAAIANERSTSIIIATAQDPEALSSSIHMDDPAPKVKVAQVLKGTGSIVKGDVIPICQGLGSIRPPEGNSHTFLIFLEGKDGETWVPSSGRFGVIGEGANGRFYLSGIREGQKSVSINELKKMIDN